MGRAGGHIRKHSSRRHDPLAARLEGNLTFEDVEALLRSAVDMRGRPAARGHDGFPQGVLAVGVLTGRQEAVHVTDDGDGAAFGACPDSGIHTYSLLFGWQSPYSFDLLPKE